MWKQRLLCLKAITFYASSDYDTNFLSYILIIYMQYIIISLHLLCFLMTGNMLNYITPPISPLDHYLLPCIIYLLNKCKLCLYFNKNVVFVIVSISPAIKLVLNFNLIISKIHLIFRLEKWHITISEDKNKKKTCIK